MTLESSRSLGHGVRVVPGDGGELVVLSETVDFGWRPRAGGQPGSAVIIDGEGFEVVACQPWNGGARWTFEPWLGEDVMRVVQPLDEKTVAAAAADELARARANRLRPVLTLLAPILGFAIARWQRRWRDEWGYPAQTATWVSAILEMLIGGACIIEFIASMGAGATIFPWLPRPLVRVGVYFFAEGIVRLIMVFSDSEPVGSLLGAAVSIFEPKREPARVPVRAPKVQRFDEDKGVVELCSPILRRDWEEPGVLTYRDDDYVLDGTRQLGESWIYRFRRAEDTGTHLPARFRLNPPPPAAEPVVREETPGLVKTVLLNIACTMAPARFQERWAWWVGMRAIWFTVAGSLVELVGGLANLRAGADGLSVPLNLFLVVEAVSRLAVVALKKKPLGSVFGLVLTPILDRVLPD